MKNRRVLISGASIAGPAVAHWLDAHGFETTVVERSKALRPGGHAVDFRGPAHLCILERMGMLDRIKEHQTKPANLVIIDREGEPLATLPAQMMGGDVEILRGDLSQLLYDATHRNTEYSFGNWITSLSEHSDGVDVTFAHGEPRTFDLVVGADGLHSGVRALAFEDPSKHIRFHGYYVAGFTGDDVLGLDQTKLYSEPGKSLTVGARSKEGLATSLFVFASRELTYDRRNVAEQKHIVSDIYADVGWEAPRVVEAMNQADNLYFDAISEVRLHHFSRGRVVLLGDAGYGGTMGGQGSGLAIVGSYILAGELALAHGDYETAYARYEEQMLDYARGCQKGAERVGPFFAPATRVGTWFRNTMYRTLTSRPLAGYFEKLIRQSASSIELREYPVA